MTDQNILETLRTISRIRLQTHARWSYDEATDEYRLPFEHPPHSDAPAEYTSMIGRLRDDAVRELREDCAQGIHDRPGAGELVRTDKELILRRPDVTGIADLGEEVGSATPVMPRYDADTQLMLARMLSFVTPEGKKSGNFGEWQVRRNMAGGEDEICMAARPAPPPVSLGFDTRRMVRDLNEIIGGENNHTDRFPGPFYVQGNPRLPLLGLRDIEPLLFDECLPALRAAARSWVQLTEERRARAADAIVQKSYTLPATRAPTPEDVTLLNGLCLAEGLPPGVIMPRPGGDVFEYVEKADGTGVLRVPIFGDGRWVGGLANELSSLLSTGTGFRLESHVARETVPFTPAGIEQLSHDSQTAIRAMRDGVEAGWVDKALQETRSLPDMAMPRKVTYVEVTAVAQDSEELQAMMAPLAQQVLRLGERLRRMLERAGQQKSQATIG